MSEGWNRSKNCQFCDQQFVDYRGDVTLRVAIWVTGTFCFDGTPPDQRFDYHSFPMDQTSHFERDNFSASIAGGKISTRAILDGNLPRITTSNGKPALDWVNLPIVTFRSALYILRQLIVFNLPKSRIGNQKVWDLLPFFAGGLVESNRRRH